MTVTNPVYPQIITEIKINGVWENISKDVISAIDVEDGFNGTDELARVASPGSGKFSLRNDSGCIGGVEDYYIPFSPHAKTGWGKGVPVRSSVKYKSATKPAFFGYISDITTNTKSKKVEVVSEDLMGIFAKANVVLPSLDFNKGIDEIAPILVAQSPIQPQSVEYNNGVDTYETVFDTAKTNTKILTELQKLCLSEFGYAFVYNDITYGEKFIVQGRGTRTLSYSKKYLPVWDGFLLKEDGGYLLQENGNKIYLDQCVDAKLVNNMESIDASYDKVVNKVIARCYPREIDTVTNAVLFGLQSPITLEAGKTQSILAEYHDPNGGNVKVAGKNMIAPVSGTDYAMFTNKDGTGTNLTANLSVTVDYAAGAVFYTLENTGATNGYVTKLQARGTAIYLYEPLDIVVQDNTSIAARGENVLNIDMKYQDEPTSPQYIAERVVRQNKDPKPLIERIYFTANTSELLMTAFMYLGVGDLVYIIDDRSRNNGYFYIQSRKFSLGLGGIIKFSWTVKKAYSLQNSYWVLGHSRLGVDTILAPS